MSRINLNIIIKHNKYNKLSYYHYLSVNNIYLLGNFGGISVTSMISFVKGKTEISLNFPNRHR